MPSTEENKPTSRHIIVKFQKPVPSGNPKISQKGEWGVKGTKSSDFSAAKPEARKQRISVLKILKVNYFQHQILHPNNQPSEGLEKKHFRKARHFKNSPPTRSF